ncbi:Hydrolase-4 domain-containing protein [Mycena kentingensis (nom. inval.)]|nr:Hydrolase-4 domain-containing protein [Mycena kentingensis (nom. inval.)]
MSTGAFLYALLRYGQKYLVYPSAFEDSPRDVSKPSELGLEYSDLQLTTSDRVHLHCYFIYQAAQSATRIRAHEQNDFPRDKTSSFADPSDYNDPALANVIMFHGNGMNYGDLMYAAKRLVMRRCNVLLLSYRGYGTSEGTPSERGLRLDAQAALNHIRSTAELAPLPTILFGTSLGGAVAIDLASRNPTTISALILENTFLSVPRLVRDWPLIGYFSFISTQRWNSASKLPSIPPTTPLLFLSGAADEVVPKKHMHGLWDIAQKRGGGKELSGLDRFESFERGTHADTFLCPGYWDKIDSWLTSITAPS